MSATCVALSIEGSATDEHTYEVGRIDAYSSSYEGGSKTIHACVAVYRGDKDGNYLRRRPSRYRPKPVALVIQRGISVEWSPWSVPSQFVRLD